MSALFHAAGVLVAVRCDDCGAVVRCNMLDCRGSVALARARSMMRARGWGGDPEINLDRCFPCTVKLN